MPTALLFPGQGSHTPAMRSVADEFAPELAELVLNEAGPDAFDRAGDSTAFAQPAIVCASLAQWIGAGRPSAGLFAGHSLGELSALAAAGSLDHADAVRLAVVRGSLMEAAAEKTPGTMVALLGDSAEARAAAAESGLEIANDNGPTQLVADGSPEAIEVVTRKGKARGVRAMELPVSGAFHTRAMAPALEPFREALEEIEIKPPTTPVHSCSTATP
ncbi:MAG TPA: ACP S-malonyltransferase, partial [Solirubrobacterales bacterium]|nr:ACP S-malonyltransferase [Solirubrobacterales bacterium]